LLSLLSPLSLSPRHQQQHSSQCNLYLLSLLLHIIR
jgi:hypothetical protein